MKQEFITAIETAAEKMKNKLIQEAHTDWAEYYSRQDLTPTQAKELAERYVLNFMASYVYLSTSKNVVK